MGGFHRKVLRDLGLDVSTVDPDPSAGADWLTVPKHTIPEVVCVATPMGSLAEQAAEWAGHEGWLLVEKPGATTVQDARALSLALEGQRVAVGYVERFNPQARRVRAHLQDVVPSFARFTRWNNRPCPDVRLDLMSHDVDLARWLELPCIAMFDCAAPRPTRRREVEVGGLTVDLTAHDTSPLHAQWHTFLSDGGGCATLGDATAVLDAVVLPTDALAVVGCA